MKGSGHPVSPFPFINVTLNWRRCRMAQLDGRKVAIFPWLVGQPFRLRALGFLIVHLKQFAEIIKIRAQASN